MFKVRMARLNGAEVRNEILKVVKKGKYTMLKLVFRIPHLRPVRTQVRETV